MQTAGAPPERARLHTLVDVSLKCVVFENGFWRLDEKEDDKEAQEHDGDQWRMADADEVLKGREIFLDEMAQAVTEDYSPSERLKRRLELMGVTYGDYIRVQDKVFTPVDDRVRGWARVGREEEGTSSYRAELAALLMLLRRVQIESDVVSAA